MGNIVNCWLFCLKLNRVNWAAMYFDVLDEEWCGKLCASVLTSSDALSLIKSYDILSHNDTGLNSVG